MSSLSKAPEQANVQRIAMWSGPRNISTAMMRAWENRADTVVVDEPLYGQYLHHTGIDHPGKDKVIAAQGEDWQQGVERCLAALPEGKQVFYQKHMTMHLLPHIDKDWLSQLQHCFLIRHPAQVLASYNAVRDEATLEDIGFIQQVALYDWTYEQTGVQSPVIDTADFLTAPAAMMPKICSALEVQFDANMLQWPAGPRDSDGVWSPYWYDSVNRSTGFVPYKPKTPKLTLSQQAIVEAAMPYYEKLYRNRIR